MTKFYVDDHGALIGAFDDDSAAPAGGKEVIIAPPDGRAVWDGAGWTVPLDIARADAKSRMVAWIGEFLSSLTEGYPPEEVASWPVKADAARLHLSGKPQAMIAIEAEITGELADDLARAIVARAESYTAIIAATAGLRRATAAEIAAAETPEAIAAALAEAQKTALSMAAQMGLPQPKDTSNA